MSEASPNHSTEGPVDGLNLRGYYPLPYDASNRDYDHDI
jgi:hypothetical protein